MVFNNTKNARFLLLTLLGSIFASISYIIFLYNPLEMLIEKYAGFYHDSIVFNLWKNPPYEIFIKVYIFNVTNPDEIKDDDKNIRVQEVGPYVYQEILYNDNITFNDNGTVSFNPQRRLKFIPERSIGNESDTLLLPNVPFLGMGAYITQHHNYLSYILRFAPYESLINITVYDFLYGYEDPLISLINTFHPGWIDFSKFGIIDRIMNRDNDSSMVTMNINPIIEISNNTLLAEEERMKLYSIQNWNGLSGLKDWVFETNTYKDPSNNSKCGFVEGSYMGTLFPRNIKENSTFMLYRRAFCRPLPISYEKTVTTSDGFEGYLYRADENFLAPASENSDNHCYCVDNNCVPKGLGDLSPCYYGIPIAMSLPHFLNSNHTLLEDIDGLQPNKDHHDITMIIHPKLGVPLQASLRLQMNLVMPHDYMPGAGPFNHKVIPLLWVDLSVDETPSVIKFYITLLYHVLPAIQKIAMYFFALSGIALILGSALVIVISNKPSNHQKSFHVNYSQIPVFSLKTKLFKPDVLIQN